MANIICSKCKASFCDCAGKGPLCPNCRNSSLNSNTQLNRLVPNSDFCLASEILYNWDRGTGVLNIYSNSGCKFTFGFEGRTYESGTYINITPNGKAHYIVAQGRDSYKTILLK